MAPQSGRSVIQWQVSLVRGFGQYFVEIMEGNSDNDWGPIFSLWNLLMVLLFGFITKKIYDCFGQRGDDKQSQKDGTESAAGGAGVGDGGASETAGSRSGVDSQLKSTDGTQESRDLLKSADGSTTLKAAPLQSGQGVKAGRVEDVHGRDQSGSGSDSGKDKKPSGVIPGAATSVDSRSNLGGRDGSGKEMGKDGKQMEKNVEKVEMEKSGGLRSHPGGRSTDPSTMEKVRDIAGDMKDLSEEERKARMESLERTQKGLDFSGKDGSKGEKDGELSKSEAVGLGKGAAAGIGSKVKDAVMGKVEEIAGELKSETEDFEKQWQKEQDRKKKEEEERAKKEEDEKKKKKEEEEKKKKEEEMKKKKEEEEKKKKEGEEKKKKEEEEKKKKEEERKKKEQEEKKRLEDEKKKKDEELKRKEDEEKERKKKEDEEKERKRKEDEEKERKRKEDEEKERKKKEDGEKKKREEEMKKKEELQKKAEEAKKQLEEAQKKKEEELRLAEENLKKKEEEMKKKLQEGEDQRKKREEELKREQEKVQVEISGTQGLLKSAPGFPLGSSPGSSAAELGKQVDDLFDFGDDDSDTDLNANEGKEVETDYVMVSPPSSPLQQVVEAPPLIPEPVKEDVQVVERKRQQVEDVMAVVSKDKYNSVSDLVNDLTSKQNAVTDFDKARALFIWLSSKDLKTLTFSNAEAGSDEATLTGLQNGNTTYAQVYQTLCKCAGIDCELIHGYAKGVGYKPGMTFDGEGFRHSWNAVKIKGEWKLVDPNWGARHVVGKKEGSPEEEKEASDENTVYELDEYYFLPESWELIHSHFPDDPEWQLRQPITKEQFENLVLCKSPFFKHNLRIASHSEAVIKVNKEAEVKIQLPPDAKDRLVFIFTLSYADSLNAAEDSHQGTPLGNFGMQRIVGNKSSVVIRPPTPGEYRLVIHVKDLSKPQRVPGKFYYSEVCEYGVLCTEAHPTPKAFPPCAHTSWGKGDSMARYSSDMKLQSSNVIIPTRKGVAEVKIGLKKNLRFLAKLKSTSKDIDSIDRYVIYRTVNNVAIFTVRAPENGEYGLELYANDKERDGSTMHHIYQYLVIAKDVKGNVEPYPQLPSTFLGPQGNFSNFGMKIVSHRDPFITTDKGKVSVEFKSEKPMKLMSQLVFISEGKQDDMSSYVLQNTTKASIEFRLELPKSGSYKFSLFGMPADQPADNVPALYNCLIECRHGNEQATPFPKQFSQWKNGGVLNRPITSQLTSAASPVKFDMKIENARDVAVVIGDNWTQLTKEGSNWKGEVNISEFVGKQTKCVICANMDENEATFSTLLEYSIADK